LEDLFDEMCALGNAGPAVSGGLKLAPDAG
jgi:hypothetical protein